MKKLFAAVTLGLFAITASACNTVSGAGEDLQSVSQDVDEAI